MELAISSSGNWGDCLRSGKYTNLIDVLIESSKECLEFSEENNFKICEVVLEPPDVLNQESQKRFIELCNSYSIKKQIHAPFLDLSLCSSNPWIARSSIDCYVQTAQICQEIGAEIMVVHPGFSGLGMRAKKRLVGSVDKLLNATIDYGVKICLENMPNFRMNIFLDEDEIEFFLSKLNRSDLYITYDTSHLWTNDGNVGVFWERFHERIKNVHIVENFDKNSDTHPDLGTGKVNFPKIIDIIRDYGYKGALVIELASAKNLLNSIQFIKQILSS